jgi:hypothetical protein
MGLVPDAALAVKNAILIVEFAKAFVEAGTPLMESEIKAAQERLRPILMTSIAFVFGSLPLAIADGARAASRIAIGTVVVGGMVSATVLAIFFVPVFFVAVLRWGGMILGLASSGASIFDVQRVFIKQAWIVNDMVTKLAAIPRALLYACLLREASLDRADKQPYATTVVWLHLSRQAQREGNLSVMDDLNKLQANCDRLRRPSISMRIEPEGACRTGSCAGSMARAYGPCSSAGARMRSCRSTPSKAPCICMPIR